MMPFSETGQLVTGRKRPFVLKEIKPMVVEMAKLLLFYNEWARSRGARFETRTHYTPSDCFKTFPFPEKTDNPAEIGEKYYNHRQSIMAAWNEGLSKTYNCFHNPDESRPDIAELRRLHKERDEQVAHTYGWQDLALEHGFHETKRGMCYTISEAAQREVLDRLLALKHERNKAEDEEQQRLNLAEPKSVKKARKPQHLILTLTCFEELNKCLIPSPPIPHCKN